jgi:hypothetical protein
VIEFGLYINILIIIITLIDALVCFLHYISLTHPFENQRRKKRKFLVHQSG